MTTRLPYTVADAAAHVHLAESSYAGGGRVALDEVGDRVAAALLDAAPGRDPRWIPYADTVAAMRFFSRLAAKCGGMDLLVDAYHTRLALRTLDIATGA